MKKIDEILKILRQEYPKWRAPAKDLAQNYRYPRTPYTILISTLLSFRTKDEVTFGAAHRLFALADNPFDMVRVSRETIARAIYPVGFYNQKAQAVLDVSHELITRFGGKVPKSFGELTSIRGVGPKTAKIVLENAYDQSVVAVDTHVHRLFNLWGIVETKTPEQTDKVLGEILEERQKKGLNRILVSFGQTICIPKRARCADCPIAHLVPCS
ncbi:MAG: endonuclease III [Epsilonproteobacteria bacterium]|nr:endonuclease III [Campylobacterota bacterium]NPA63530.1 endonuclease III [Campylobacterota bacterium]